MLAKLLLIVVVAATAAQATLTCQDVHYWIEEGKLLTATLASAPRDAADFNQVLYTQSPTISAATCDTGSVTYGYVPNSGPNQYTASAPGYTPIQLAFTNYFSNTGAFQYIHTPTKAAPRVWNGYDKFDFTATCGASTCTGRAYVNVVFTKAATQNTPAASFIAGYPNGQLCDNTKSCKSTGAAGVEKLWLARQTLPRIWDVQLTEAGQPVRPTVAFDGGKPTDGLDFEWKSNYALITTYGSIGNMAVRFPTFEIVEWQPGQFFEPGDFTGAVAGPSTGFNQQCLQYQGQGGTGRDVWVFNENQLDGTLGDKYASTTEASWYQKFGGKHDLCDVFASATTSCKVAPLLTPRTGEDEDEVGQWRVEIKGCEYRYQGKFTWNAMRTQSLSIANRKAFAITGGEGADYVITTEIYNQAVQPNSWTQPSRGFVEIDYKYLLKVTLASDTDFQFELGIDIFTVDLQQFRYFAPDQSFGYNMLVYPKRLNTLAGQNSAPDRRILGYKWVEQKWIAPNADQCPSCGSNGRVASLADPTTCVDGESTDAGAYSGPSFPAAACPSSGTNKAVVALIKGPEIASGECPVDPMIVVGTRGISAVRRSDGSCNTDVQNITLRGTAVGSGSTVSETFGFGFEGRITLTFLLANGEHPHFVIEPKMYVKSISVNGAFAGTSSTCRGSPSWPVATATQIPQYMCEEVDARTFGPTDWAAIFFDIKDIDANLVSLKSLYITVGTLNIRFYPTTDISGVTSEYYSPKFTYFNFRNLKTLAGFSLANPPSPVAGASPQNTDFGFAFTPGAHNENAKITIYCTLSIKQTASNKRRFASQAADSADNTVQERISITQRTASNSALASNNNQVVESSSNASSNAGSSGSSVTVMVLAAACAVLLAAVIGMVLYVVRQHSNNAPKRVSSTA